MYSQPSPPVDKRRPDGLFDGTFRFKVDNNDGWVVKPGVALVINGLSIDGTKAIYTIRIDVKEEFIVELAKGSFLRMLDVNLDKTDRFNLNGSKAAILRAYIHTLSKQMGNSAAMLEKHYSKMTATMAADRLV